MNLDDECEQFEDAFYRARQRALAFIEAYNAKLPNECPQCRDDAHVCGLPCLKCSYVHKTPWAILRATEWGYDVVPLTNRSTVLKAFKVK